MSVPSTIQEAERAVLYVSCALAVLLLARCQSLGALLAGILIAIVAVAMYSLATRFFPERLQVFDPVAEYRLATPVGYWNALAILAVIGILLAIGFATRAERVAARALAGAAIVVLVPTVYFTFSRGAWIALAAGLAAYLVFDPRRTQFLATLSFLVPAPAFVFWLSATSEPLTRAGASANEISEAGHRLALIILLLGFAAAVLVVVFAYAEKRVTVGNRVRVAFAALVVVAAASALGGLLARAGGPAALGDAARGSSDPPRASGEGNLNTRLLNLSTTGRSESWRLAWSNFEAHPWLGAGAGTYAFYWLEHHAAGGGMRDAHNLYLETLAELGIVGGSLLLAALTVPLVAAFRLRAASGPLTGAFAAYVAYLVHAGVDFDWEMPAVTLPALVCACVLIAAARRHERRPLSLTLRAGGIVAFVVVGSLAFVALAGHRAVAASADAAARGEWNVAKSEARKAARWAPWSADPWSWLGHAALGQGDLREARANFRKAIADDPNNWVHWFDLARASGGAERQSALREASRLNPHSPVIRAFRSVG